MTQWVEQTGRGRKRGPSGLVRAWLQVIGTPWRFFDRGVAPGDQAPGLVFLAVVVAIEEASRYAFVAGAAPVVGDRPVASAAFALMVAVVLIAPIGLHLLGAIQTVLLWPVTEDRAGVSETVQVLAYATAPCVFAGIPFPALTVLATAYGTALLFVGLAMVHDLEYHAAILAGAIPAALLFGVAFGGFDAISALV